MKREVADVIDRVFGVCTVSRRVYGGPFTGALAAE